MPRNPFDSTLRLLHALRRDLQQQARTVGLSRLAHERLQEISDGIDRLEMAEMAHAGLREPAACAW
jgi:hypothetical protein